MVKAMGTGLDVDVDLELMYDQEAVPADEIHQGCTNTEWDLHSVCGGEENVTHIVPEWVQITCEPCIEWMKEVMRGGWMKCLGCGKHFDMFSGLGE